MKSVKDGWKLVAIKFDYKQNQHFSTGTLVYCSRGLCAKIPSTTAPITWCIRPSFAESVLASRANRDGAKFVFTGWNARLVAAGLANAAVCKDRANEL